MMAVLMTSSSHCRFGATLDNFGVKTQEDLRVKTISNL